MAWCEPRGKRWRGMYQDANGKSRSAGSSTSKREAKRMAEEEEAKIRSGIWFDPAAGKMTFGEYFEEHWLPNRILADNTQLNYETHYNATLEAAFGHVEIRKITGPVIQRWVVALEKGGMKPRTIKDKFTVLQTVLAARQGVSAKFDGLIAVNPCENVTLPHVDKRKVDVYEVEEVDLLMRHIDPWWHPMMSLESDLGVRWGELMGFQALHVDGCQVRVEQTIVELPKARTGNGTRFKVKPWPKGEEPRNLALTPEAAAVIETMVRERALFPRDRLFSMPGKGGLPMRTQEWPTGLPVSRHYFREQVWYRAHEASGVRRRRFHDLRGSVISWILAGGGDVTAAMEWAGHKQLSTTMVYVDALKDADQRALSALAVARGRARDHG